LAALHALRFSYVNKGVLESEGTTTIEGIGIGRVTSNFKGRCASPLCTVDGTHGVLQKRA
jgi:hypothetical protein